MTPADRRWRALAKWLREQERTWRDIYGSGNAVAYYFVQIKAVQREMRRLSRRPRAPKKETRR